VVVRLYDTGPGVAHPDDLFKAFQAGAHASGLGLYISRAILRSHGGNLRYEPQPEGSCFAWSYGRWRKLWRLVDGYFGANHSRVTGR